MKVFEYVDRRGIGVFLHWYFGLQKAQRAAIEVKLRAVMSAGEAGDLRFGELPPNMFRGPVKHAGRFYANTYKFTVKGPVTLVPLACQGPLDNKLEWTLLVPVIEKGNQYPPGCFSDAENRRLEIIADPENRRREIVADDL
jgi:hypothetical protein